MPKNKIPKAPRYKSPLDIQIADMLAFNKHRAYVGELSLARVRTWQDSESEFPELVIGKITPDIICDALWKLMSLNPLRYGTKSPFIFDGVNHIFKFTDGNFIAPQNGRGAMGNVAHHLHEFMTANGAAHGLRGQWTADINAPGGVIYDKTMALQDAMVHLMYAFKVIANQNAHDFQTPKYHDSIVAAVRQQNNPSRPTPPVQPTPPNPTKPQNPNINPGADTQLEIDFNTPVAAERSKQTSPYKPLNNDARMKYNTEMPSDHDLDAEDSIDITLQNRGSVSEELYLQALADKQYFDDR